MPLQSRSLILPALSPDAIKSGNPHHPPRLSGIPSSQWRVLYRAQINAIFIAPVINVAYTYRVSNDVFGYIFSQKSRKPTKLSFISLPLSPGDPVSPTKFGSLKLADHRLIACRKSISLHPKYTKVKKVNSECPTFTPCRISSQTARRDHRSPGSLEQSVSGTSG